MGSSETSEELDSLEATAVKDKEDWQEESLPPGSAKLLGHDPGPSWKSGTHGTGGGLSSEELQELHKTDPKKVKRILANRSSAARSKVRKLRYIAELDSRAAILHQQVSDMTVELRTLQDNTARLGEENDWLNSQMMGLEAQNLRMDLETETLQQHLRQTNDIERGLHAPFSLQNSTLSQFGTSYQTPPRLPSAKVRRRQAEIPPSVFQGLKHDQQYRASPALPGQNSSDSLAHVAAPYYGNLPGLPAHLQTDMPNFNFGTEQAGQLPSDSFVHGPTYYSGNPPGLPAHLHHETPTFSLDQSGRNLVSLHSINSSEGSAMSSTTQELQLSPEDPALLSLLRGIDLGHWQPRDPAIAHLPPTGSLARSDRSRSLGVTDPRRHLFPQGDFQIGQGPGGLGLGSGSAALRQLGLVQSISQPPPCNSAAPTHAADTLFLLQDPLAGRLSLPQGLGRWPRHFSDPQGYHRGS